MKVLVTGAGGFLGKAIVKKLLQRGDEVKGIARSSYPELEQMGVSMIMGDITCAKTVANAVKGCDAVIHVAAKMGLAGNYQSFYETNVTGTQNIIDACKQHGINKLVYTSTPSVVFHGKDAEGVNESEPYATHHLCHYSKTKMLAEQLVLAANNSELLTVALRPHMIWGVDDPHLVARLIDRAKAGQMRLIGAKNKLVDSIYVDNAADAHLLALDKLTDNTAIAGKAYFLSNDEPIYMADALNRILAAAKLPAVEKRIPQWLALSIGAVLEAAYALFKLKGEPKITRYVAYELSTAHWFDISAAKQDLGYEPKISIDEGLQLLEESFRR